MEQGGGHDGLDIIMAVLVASRVNARNSHVGGEVSEFAVPVLRLGKVGKHPNADSLSITHVSGHYPVIFRTGEFGEGDLAVYVPVDAVVPKDDPRWGWLTGSRRIKARRLRGIFSMGVLVKPEPGWVEGQDVRQELRVEKYEEPVLSATHGENEPGPPNQWSIYDLEAIRRYPHVLKIGEQIVVTEKVHGANGRWTYQDGRLWVGSHRCWKAESENIWWQVAKRYDLENRLRSTCPGVMVYAEVYGYVQDLRYGAKQGQTFVGMFDARSAGGEWLGWDNVYLLAQRLGLPTVPVLYRGEWSMDLLSLAEGKTTINSAEHVREGIVIEAVPTRFDEIGRVKLKHAGEGYHLRKEGNSPIKHKT